MKIVICIGSTCHLRGANEVIARFQELIETHHLKNRVEFLGKFCLGRCGSGVSVMIDERAFSIRPEEVDDFFQREVLNQLNG